MNKPQEVLEMLIDTLALPDIDQLNEMGLQVGKLYTDMGLPPDIALERLTWLNKLQKLAVLNAVCGWLIQHKRNSGATEKSIERQRKTNLNMLMSYVAKGEAGVY